MRSVVAARSIAASGSVGPPAPACSTRKSTPSASHARTVEPASARDFATNSLFGDAMFTRYGAWATSGPRPEAVQLSRNGGRLLVGHARTRPAARVGDEDLRGVGPAETAFLDGAGDPAGAASDVRPDPHTR